MMKKLTFITLLLAFVGCGGGHYYKTEQENVRIYLYKPDVNVVYFASSLDNYMLHMAERIDNDMWVVQVPGTTEFRYFYMVDGLFFIPPCRMKEKDDFGSENCFYVPDL
jgi:hypothetical protein